MCRPKQRSTPRCWPLGWNDRVGSLSKLRMFSAIAEPASKPVSEAIIDCTRQHLPNPRRHHQSVESQRRNRSHACQSVGELLKTMILPTVYATVATSRFSPRSTRPWLHQDSPHGLRDRGYEAFSGLSTRRHWTCLLRFKLDLILSFPFRNVIQRHHESNRSTSRSTEQCPST